MQAEVWKEGSTYGGIITFIIFSFIDFLIFTTGRDTNRMLLNDIKRAFWIEDVDMSALLGHNQQNCS